MDVITALFNAVKQAITEIISGLVNGAESLIYVVDGETKKLSTLALIIFTLVGISIAFAIVKWLLGLLRLR